MQDVQPRFVPLAAKTVVCHSITYMVMGALAYHFLHYADFINNPNSGMRPTTSLWLILAGGFLMQFMVQGAWGVIPAHINELSPDALRGFFPGLAYQLGVLIASRSAYVEAVMAHSMSYGRAMGLFALIVLIAGAVVVGLGPEEHRIEFGRGG